MSTEAILMKYHSPTHSKAPSCFSGRCSRLDGQRISENPRVIRRSLTMMLCKPLSNLLCDVSIVKSESENVCFER